MMTLDSQTQLKLDIIDRVSKGKISISSSSETHSKIKANHSKIFEKVS